MLWLFLLEVFKAAPKLVNLVTHLIVDLLLQNQVLLSLNKFFLIHLALHQIQLIEDFLYNRMLFAQ